MSVNADPSSPVVGRLSAVMDRVGWTRAHVVVVGLVLAGMFFDAFEQDTTGAITNGLKASFHMSTGGLAFLNTALFIGGLVGRLGTGYLADRKGRRFALSFNLLVYTLGGILSAVSTSQFMLEVSRFVVGIGLGGEFTVGLTLVSEMVATKYRGAVSASLNIGSGGIGNFAAFGFFLLVLGPLNNVLGGTADSWRWLYVFLAVPAVLVVFIRRYMPESPRFLLSRGRVDDANAALTKLATGRLRRSANDAVTPYLTSADIPDVVSRTAPLRSLATRTSLRRTAAIGIASWMSFGAQITLLVLMPTILVHEGYSISTSLAFTMTMNFGSLLGACAATYLAPRLGRRSTVLGGAVLGCLAAIAFAELAHGAALILVLGATFQFFALLLNTTLAAWSPEVYPTEVRALGTSLVNGLGNVSGAVMPLVAAPVFDAYGVSGVFLMLAVMYVLLGTAARFAPETYRLSLEEINRTQV